MDNSRRALEVVAIYSVILIIAALWGAWFMKMPSLSQV